MQGAKRGRPQDEQIESARKKLSLLGHHSS
jgi:hypothetical protein